MYLFFKENAIKKNQKIYYPNDTGTNCPINSQLEICYICFCGKLVIDFFIDMLYFIFDYRYSCFL